MSTLTMHFALQAVLTDSVLLMDMSRPVPLEDFFAPRSPALHFADVRACLEGPLNNKSKARLRRSLTSIKTLPLAIQA